MRRLLLVLSLAAIAAGCSNRDRRNPLDPANPQTGGRPAGFNARAGFTSVTLTWTAQPSLAIDGFQLEVLRTGDSLYRPLGDVLPPGASAFLDSGEPNGRRIHYRLYYVLHGEPANLPAEDEATPGPLRPWVTEFGDGHLTRLTPDGRDVEFRVDHLGLVQSLAVEPLTGTVWCSARYDGFLSGCDTEGDRLLQLTGLHQPGTLALNPLDGSIWVCVQDGQDGQVLHFGPDGFARSPGALTSLSGPEGVAVSPRDLSIWVCDGAGNRVRHYDASGALLSTIPLAGPSRVRVDSLSNVAWVTSNRAGRIWRLTAGGTVLDSSLAAGGPVGIALDRVRGRAWVADAFDGRVLALDASTLAVLFTVDGLPGAWDVTVDPVSGDAWATVRGLGQVVRIGSDGHVADRCDGLADPTEIGLDPGTN